LNRMIAASRASLRSAVIEAINADCSPAADPKWWIRLAWVTPISPATDVKVTAFGPRASNRSRAEARASRRASSGERRRRLGLSATEGGIGENMVYAMICLTGRLIRLQGSRIAAPARL